MDKKEQEEMLNLLRKQDVRAQDREEQSRALRGYASGAGIFAFIIFLAWMSMGSENSDEIDNPWMLYAAGISLCIALILYVASYFRDV